MLRRRGCITFGYVGRMVLMFTDWMLNVSKNHLIETASTSTGSLLVWDTGEYEMLPYRENIEQLTDDELSIDSDGASNPFLNLSDSEKLHTAFKNVGGPLYIHSSNDTNPSSAQNSNSPPWDPSTTWLHSFHPSPGIGKPP